MCIFCKIVNKEIPNNTILENDDFLSFHDIAPQAKIHALVIPKVHVESFEDVSPELMSKMTSFIKEVTSELNLKENGYRLVTNIGEHGCQEVKHLHFHILAGEKIGKLVAK